jgi:hypothetical protein
LKKIKTIQSKDGIEYNLTVFEDIITLNKGQISLIEEQIQSIKSSEVENFIGVPINAVTDKQSAQVIKLISTILEDFSSVDETVKLEVIDITFHVDKDKLNDVEIYIERDWGDENMDYEIAECLKRSFRVEQLRIRFDPKSKDSWPHFGFTVRGFKGGKGIYDQTEQIVIFFNEDPLKKGKTILVITILTPDY